MKLDNNCPAQWVSVEFGEDKAGSSPGVTLSECVISAGMHRKDAVEVMAVPVVVVEVAGVQRCRLQVRSCHHA